MVITFNYLDDKYAAVSMNRNEIITLPQRIISPATLKPPAISKTIKSAETTITAINPKKILSLNVLFIILILDYISILALRCMASDIKQINSKYPI
ncbi:MAG: hypothetical protein CMO01_32150 [Thalassobius sp.]|nr:hypothetical protein [Thalassovita sp.]